MNSDDELRAMLGGLADEGAPRLDEEARARVLDRVEKEGPEIVARTHWGRIAGIGVMLAAAAALIFFVATAETPEAPLVEGPEGATCERWSAAIGTPRRGLLRLGRRGEARVDGELSMSAPDGCTTELELASGRVTVRADDLGQGTMRVLAGDVVVEVRGTRFTVIRDEPHVEVLVEEGHVVVRAPGEREIHLHGGERWSRGDRTASVEPSVEPEELIAGPVDPAPAARVARTPRDEPAQGEPPPTPGQRIGEAEALWRSGERDRARNILRDVGRGEGSTADVALLRLARHEVEAGELAVARSVLATQRHRFPRSRFGPEVLWLQADVARRLGDTAGRTRALSELRERYPDSPHATHEGAEAP